MTIVWIHGEQLDVMTKEADRSFGFETGGILAGYVVEAEYVITRAIGPGPAAVHRRARFEPDHDWQCRELDRLFEETGGASCYLGEWHTHPRGVARLSRLDRSTLSAIAAFKGAREPEPLMVVGAGEPGRWTWRANVYSGGRVGLLREAVVSRELQTFQD